MLITTITGLYSLDVFHYHGKKYFLLGDKHYSRAQGECAADCDDFDDHWQKRYKNGSCQSIGLLLHDWLQYNNDHDIVTDFYVEVKFTKQNERSDQLTTLAQPHNASLSNQSWLQLIPILLKSCFVFNKQDCPYYPNIRSHYVDIRYIYPNADANPSNVQYLDPFNIKKVILLLAIKP